MTRATTSASNIFRRFLCPGSERLEEGLPEDESEQSREGVLLHAMDANPALDRATLKPDQRDLLKLSGELEEFVFARAIERFKIGPDEPYTQGTEEELWVHKGIRAFIPGHCDKWRHYHKRGLLLIVDKKFGYIETTPAAANYQLRTYAVAGAHRWTPVSDVVVAITQPRLPYEERVTMATYTFCDIAAAKQELFAIKEASARQDAPLRAGEEQCRYCKAKMLCQAFQEKFQGGLKLIPFPSSGLSVPAREEQISQVLAAMPDEKLALVLDSLQLAGFVADPARDEARRRVASGRLPGWKLEKAKEWREVVDTERALALLTTSGTVTRDEAMASSELSLHKLETKYRERTNCTWKEAKEKIGGTLSGVIESGHQRPALKRVKV